MTAEKMPSINKELMVCPTCAGSGRASGRVCLSCGGLGSGAFIGGHFFYADVDLSWPLIVLRQVKKNVYHILEGLALLVSALGALAFGWWLLEAGSQLTALNNLYFWRIADWRILFFYVSLFFVMWLIYRGAEKTAERHKIHNLKWREAPTPEWRDLAQWPKVNVLAGLSDDLLSVLEKTYIMAGNLKHSPISPLHLFYSLVTQNGEVATMFVRMNVPPQDLMAKLNNQLGLYKGQNAPALFSASVKEVLIRSYLEAMSLGEKEVRPMDILEALVKSDDLLKEILYDVAVDDVKLANTIAWSRINDRLLNNYRLYKKMARFKPGSNMDRAYTAVATPFLDQFAYDLTAAGKYGRLDLCVGRDQEMKEIFEQLESGQRGVVLVGEDGVGKNQIAQGLAQLMVTEEVPAMLKDKRLVELDIPRLLGGAAPAEAQERMLMAVNEILQAGNIILYMQDIENATGLSAGSGDSLDISEILAGAVSRQGLYLVATCTKEHFVRNLEGGPLGQVLARIEVLEPEDNAAIQMVESKVAGLENQFQVYYSYDALSGAVKLSGRYLHDQYLPAKAITILEKAGVGAVKARGAKTLVTAEDVAEVVSEFTHVPVARVGQAESALLLNLEAKIHERMVGQEEAVKLVAESLRRARAELREGKRPIASFLFLGPTGVGKTELAKTISQVYFGAEDYMIRVDMSEYQLNDSVDKMIGTPEGAKGYLTEKVRQAPFSLILLDEIEKAHPDILNLFLQVMDDGRLTDGQGRTIDFTNSIIIATSNIGAVFIQEQVKVGTELNKIRQELVDKYLVEKMRPELINRFDGIIVFRPLTIGEVATIARLLLNKTADLLKGKGIGLEISDLGLQVLAKAGFQPEFGARPLRRLLQDKIDNIIANKLLSGELTRRDVVNIDDQAEVTVRKAAKL